MRLRSAWKVKVPESRSDPPWSSSPSACWKWSLWRFGWTTHLDTCGVKVAHQSASAELLHRRQRRFSAGGLRDFTASESPFSYLMSTLTLPQIRPWNKGLFNRVGVAWTGKDCFVDNCTLSRSFLRARLLRTIFRQSAHVNPMLAVASGGWPVPAARNTLDQRACVLVCVRPQARCLAAQTLGRKWSVCL